MRMATHRRPVLLRGSFHGEFGSRSLTAGLARHGGSHTYWAGRPWPRSLPTTTSSSVILVGPVDEDSGAGTNSTTGAAGTGSFSTGVAVNSFGACAPSSDTLPLRE